MYSAELAKLLNQDEAIYLPNLTPVADKLERSSRLKGKYVWRGEKCATMEYLLLLKPGVTFGDFSPLNQANFDVLITELELLLREHQIDLGLLIQAINDVASDADRKSCIELLRNRSK